MDSPQSSLYICCFYFILLCKPAEALSGYAGIRCERPLNPALNSRLGQGLIFDMSTQRHSSDCPCSSQENKSSCNGRLSEIVLQGFSVICCLRFILAFTNPRGPAAAEKHPHCLVLPLTCSTVVVFGVTPSSLMFKQLQFGLFRSTILLLFDC